MQCFLVVQVPDRDILGYPLAKLTLDGARR